MPGFVHLHVHSSYSLLQGALTIARLCELAKADRQPALALTDTDNTVSYTHLTLPTTERV